MPHSLPPTQKAAGISPRIALSIQRSSASEFGQQHPVSYDNYNAQSLVIPGSDARPTLQESIAVIRDQCLRAHVLTFLIAPHLWHTENRSRRSSPWEGYRFCCTCVPGQCSCSPTSRLARRDIPRSPVPKGLRQV